MKFSTDEIVLLIIGFAIGMLFIVFMETVSDYTYRDGQIDCINGEIQYELVKQGNNELKWEYKTK
jgi:hypothetical protein